MVKLFSYKVPEMGNQDHGVMKETEVVVVSVSWWVRDQNFATCHTENNVIQNHSSPTMFDNRSSKCNNFSEHNSRDFIITTTFRNIKRSQFGIWILFLRIRIQTHNHIIAH